MTVFCPHYFSTLKTEAELRFETWVDMTRISPGPTQSHEYSGLFHHVQNIFRTQPDNFMGTAGGFIKSGISSGPTQTISWVQPAVSSRPEYLQDISRQSLEHSGLIPLG
jgi:hypothetical protein